MFTPDLKEKQGFRQFQAKATKPSVCVDNEPKNEGGCDQASLPGEGYAVPGTGAAHAAGAGDNHPAPLAHHGVRVHATGVKLL